MGIQSETPQVSPPPAKKKTGLVIGILAVLLICCICLVAAGIGVYFYRDQIPGVSGLFATPTLAPTPTPEGVRYDSDRLGIHLYYPAGWYLEEDEEDNIVAFISSPDILEAPEFPPNGAVFVLMRDRIILEGFQMEGVDVTSPAAILEYLPDMFGAEDMEEIEAPVLVQVAGYPGGRSLYVMDDGVQIRTVVGFAVAMSGDLPTIALFLVDETIWPATRPVMEDILSSLSIDAVIP
ncbi:MAG: hypothetical protein AB1442_11615 [Nitrospirota bacterium]